MTSVIDAARRQVRSAALPLTAYAARIARSQHRINAFSFVAPDLHDPQEAGVRPHDVRPAIAGAAIAVKASLAVEGMPTTCSSRVLAGQGATRDCKVVARLRTEGAVIAGQTNMDEFGIGTRTQNSLHGFTRNPWNDDHTPGGSSGGSAAAVAAGMCFAALGVDTAGSIRIPAALCGVTGLMPCSELVGTDEQRLGGTRFDRVGPIGRTAADCALLLDAIRMPGHAAIFPQLAALPAGVKIGIADQFMAGPVAEIPQCVTDAKAVLREMGFDVQTCSVARIDVRPMLDVLAWDRFQTLGSMLEANRDRLEPTTRGPLEDAMHLSRASVESSARNCDELATRFLNEMEPFDILMMPTTLIAAPKCDAPYDVHRVLLANTYAANITGQPAISLPCGFVAGLPVGLMLLGRRGATALLLKVAHAFQCATTHHQAQPTLRDGDST
jgi:aspartyl-tRNA(Asn)/glutamyl-tRNA(Gln) amidotransferase subunit A